MTASCDPLDTIGAKTNSLNTNIYNMTVSHHGIPMPEGAVQSMMARLGDQSGLPMTALLLMLTLWACGAVITSATAGAATGFVMGINGNAPPCHSKLRQIPSCYRNKRCCVMPALMFRETPYTRVELSFSQTSFPPAFDPPSTSYQSQEHPFHCHMQKLDAGLAHTAPGNPLSTYEAANSCIPVKSASQLWGSLLYWLRSVMSTSMLVICCKSWDGMGCKSRDGAGGLQSALASAAMMCGFSVFLDRMGAGEAVAQAQEPVMVGPFILPARLPVHNSTPGVKHKSSKTCLSSLAGGDGAFPPRDCLGIKGRLAVRKLW